MGEPSRTEELANNLCLVRERIAAAARSAGRRVDEITLIGVTKGWPADDVRILHGLGLKHFAENIDQHAAPKAEACRDLDIEWHFVGQLQSNKAASVARYASVVQSVDRASLVHALSKAASRAERSLDCLVQVKFDSDQGRGRIGRAGPRSRRGDRSGRGPSVHGPHDRGPIDSAPSEVFSRFADLSRSVRAVHSEAGLISAGMSGDFEEAICAGATHVRVGSALLGERIKLR
ncbi:YggS family pyridoxal phosphate-dependent enzyme [Streptacidiphilus sp. 4-A2]|nr:YggS family pyridoxal phosphate-dependent enzyme [Streptacidiphilus sp. 4-A2]